MDKISNDPPSEIQFLKQALTSWRGSGLTEIPRFNPAAIRKKASDNNNSSPVLTEKMSDSSLVLTSTDAKQTQAKLETLEQLRQQVASCCLCPELARTRTQTVFGVGNVNARLLFLGEAPGADEDAQGVPFVGRSGRLLTDMLEKGMKISRQDVYICNILRCRPPENRNPNSVEANCCRPFFEAQIKTVNPEFICCLGTVAAQNLLQITTPIGKLRGSFHDWQGYKVLCTYHPSYLLRNPPAKKDAWADLQILMRAMGLPVQ